MSLPEWTDADEKCLGRLLRKRKRLQKQCVQLTREIEPMRKRETISYFVNAAKLLPTEKAELGNMSEDDQLRIASDLVDQIHGPWESIGISESTSSRVAKIMETHKVSARPILDEIEAALTSIADGIDPADAVLKAFNVINRERCSSLSQSSSPN